MISFSSTPELPETDILSLLVIGKTTDRLTSAEQGALSTQVQQIARGVIAAKLEQAIGEQLGSEIIEITPGETLGAGAISAGRYLPQKLFVSVGRRCGDTEGTAVDFLWRRDY